MKITYQTGIREIDSKRGLFSKSEWDQLIEEQKELDELDFISNYIGVIKSREVKEVQLGKFRVEVKRVEDKKTDNND